jgi:hypothetical protein
MYVMSAMVRAIAYGDLLEDYLDRKLDRVKTQNATIPSFIANDPDFAVPTTESSADAQSQQEVASDDSPTATRGEDDGISTTTLGSATLGAAGSFFDLPEAARQLDATLYSVLKMCVKGCKRILLDCTSFPSYVQGMCILARHADISRNDRITRAFDGVDKLSFNGDVTVWQADTVRAIRELLDSGASIMHFVLARIMKSFNGKLKTIQYRIAQDINSRAISDNTNIYDMVQSYATEIASVGDSKHQTNNVNVTCGYCQNVGHTENECRKKQAAQKGKGKKRWQGHVCG